MFVHVDELLLILYLHVPQCKHVHSVLRFTSHNKSFKLLEKYSFILFSSVDCNLTDTLRLKLIKNSTKRSTLKGDS